MGSQRATIAPVRAILFVCAGNICRSPIAEARFRQTMGSRPGLSALEIGSAGTIALDGNPAAPNAVRAARDELGLDITGHRARNIEGLDADLILAMDGMVTRDLLRLSLTGRVELLGTYAGTGEIVEDPYGCPIEIYRACARHLDRLIRAAAARLEQDLRNPHSSSGRP
jgi:protein-tyrosine-phosphatase